MTFSSDWSERRKSSRRRHARWRMRNSKKRRTAKDRKEDVKLLDAIMEKHVSSAFNEAWNLLAQRNPHGSAERASGLMSKALSRRADFYAAFH
jgi:hypothetical protein